MFDNFIKYLQGKFAISESEIEMVMQVCRLKKLRKRQYLLQEGDIWRYNAFVSKGLLRTYSVDDKGQEHIFQFSPADWWAGDRRSYLYESEAQYNIEALEDSEIVLIAKGDFEDLFHKVPGFGAFMYQLVERSLLTYQKRIHSGISYTAEEKYHEFLRAYPDLSNRVPQHMIASYLGVSPETLSRIRKK